MKMAPSKLVKLLYQRLTRQADEYWALRTAQRTAIKDRDATERRLELLRGLVAAYEPREDADG